VGRLRDVGVWPELLPGLLAVGVFVAWGASEGGFPPTSWYPGALFLLGLLAVTVVAYRRAWRLPEITVGALVLLGAFTLWSFLSITWADVKGDAWDGANRTLLYFTVFALFSLPSWRPEAASVLFGAYALAIAAVGAITLLAITSSDDPLLSFIGGRLAEPTGYHNGTAALSLSAFFPALFLASRRETPWPARGLLLAAAGLVLQMSILSQSRGALIAFPITLAVYLAIVPGRVRSVVTLLPVAAATALAADPLLDVYTAAREGEDVAGTLDGATRAVVISSLILLAVGVGLALAERTLRVSKFTARRAGQALSVASGAGVIVGVVLLIGVIGNPVSWAGDRWEDFKGGYSEQGFGASRFTGGLGSNRYDFWRVALDEFADSPITGIGSENFAVPYLEERRSGEEPLHPHSLPIRMLSQTGIVGAVLFGGFVALAVASGMSDRRGAATPFARALRRAAIVAFGYWFVHSAGDWFWALPGLGAPAFAWLALAGRVEQPTSVGAAPAFEQVRPAMSRAVAVMGVLLGLVAVGSYALPWAAARDVERAATTWKSDPAGAYDQLDRARTLNFLSDRPDLVAGTIAARREDRERMRDSFEAALGRNPYSWYALLELGVLDATEGDRASALRRLRQATRLNPSDPAIGSTLRRVRAGDPVSLERINRRLLGRICRRLGRTQETRYCR
jgi:O-antigen ligase